MLSHHRKPSPPPRHSHHHHHDHRRRRIWHVVEDDEEQQQQQQDGDNDGDEAKGAVAAVVGSAVDCSNNNDDDSNKNTSNYPLGCWVRDKRTGKKGRVMDLAVGPDGDDDIRAATKATATPLAVVVEFHHPNSIATTDAVDGDGSVVAQETIATRHLHRLHCDASTTPNNNSTGTTTILVTATTRMFRQLARHEDLGGGGQQHPPPRGGVFEIGCSTGGTSAIVWQNRAVPRWLGIDTSATMIRSVQGELRKLGHWTIRDSGGGKTHNNNDNNNQNGATMLQQQQEQKRECWKLDPLMDPDNATRLVSDYFSFSEEGGAQQETHDPLPGRLAVLIDIGGDRLAGAVLLMLDWVLQSFPDQCHCIIVKSETVHKALRDLQRPSGASTTTTNTKEEGLCCDDWYLASLRRAVIESFPRHALKAPKRLAPPPPLSGTDAMRQLICRYHNYSVCHQGDDCTHDHRHCHWCGRLGHTAAACPEVPRAATNESRGETGKNSDARRDW
jgi:hypothetical protein